MEVGMVNFRGQFSEKVADDKIRFPKKFLNISNKFLLYWNTDNLILSPSDISLDDSDYIYIGEVSINDTLSLPQVLLNELNKSGRDHVIICGSENTIEIHPASKWE